MKRSMNLHLLILLLILSVVSCSKSEVEINAGLTNPPTEVEKGVDQPGDGSGGDNGGGNNNEPTITLTVEKECGDLSSSQDVICLIEESGMLIREVRIIEEYSQDVCTEGVGWKVGEDSKSLVMSNGCHAFFELELLNEAAIHILEQEVASDLFTGFFYKVENVHFSNKGRGGMVDFDQAYNTDFLNGDYVHYLLGESAVSLEIVIISPLGGAETKKERAKGIIRLYLLDENSVIININRIGFDQLYEDQGISLESLQGAHSILLEVSTEFKTNFNLNLFKELQIYL